MSHRLILDFLGEEARQSLAPTNRRVWILLNWIWDYVAKIWVMAVAGDTGDDAM